MKLLTSLPLIPLALCSLLYTSISGTADAANSVDTKYLTAHLISSETSIQAGKPFDVGLYFELKGNWHTYYKEPGDAGFPTSIEWTLPEGFTASEIQWPKPKEFDTAGIKSWGYSNEVLHVVTITPPADLTEGQSVLLNAQAAWLACDDICVPGSAELDLTLNVTLGEPEASQHAALFEQAKSSLDVVADDKTTTIPSSESSSTTMSWPFAMLLAFVGGLILNLMPCVFPVLSLKIFGFVQQSGEDSLKTKIHGLVFALGVLLSFWVLAGGLLILRAGGAELGWGYQLQNPLFITFLAFMFFILALNMAGVFEIGTSLMNVAGKYQGAGGHLDSFFSGVLATLVATPCTAPFMGASLGFAITQPPLVSMLIFTALGMGMATPYLILSFNPDWLKFLPRPGAWMEAFKQSMSFLLFGTVVWLTWVLGHQTNIDHILFFLIGLLLLALGAWIYGRWSPMNRSVRSRIISSVITVILIITSIGVALPKTDKENLWQNYSPSLVEQLRSENKAVFVDFTAAWCLTCQVNKKTVLQTKDVVNKFKENQVELIQADWTKRDSQITQALEKLGRSGVPVYVLYPKEGQEPVILPEILTKEIVIQELEKL
ncbi:MAG: thioredoxin family protein [Verrucomicrobiota bacterium]